jgi:MFS family permease
LHTYPLLTNRAVPPLPLMSLQYIAELSPPAIRGSLVGIYEINNQLSSLLGYWCNYIVNEYIPPTETRQWQIPLALQIVPSALLFLAALFVLPESPRFLVKKGKTVQARKVLTFVRHLSAEHEYINTEMDEIQEAIQRQSQPLTSHPPSKFGLFRELWWKGNRNRVFIGLGLMIGQNLTGINGVNFYTPTIFKSIGFDGTNVVLLASGSLPSLPSSSKS